MKIEKIDISKLVHDPANARNHSDKNIEAIKGSLVRFGQQKPIVVTGDNVVIAGNGTLEAAKQLAWKKIEIVRTKLSGLDLVAYGLADNRTSELAEWNDEVLGKLLHGLRENDFDLTSIGFDTSYLDGVVDEINDSQPNFNVHTISANQESDGQEFMPDIDDKNDAIKSDKHILIVQCDNDIDLQDLFEELNQRDYKVKRG